MAESERSGTASRARQRVRRIRRHRSTSWRRRCDVGELDEDESVSATTPMAFEVDVDAGEVFSFIAESKTRTVCSACGHRSRWDSHRVRWRWLRSTRESPSPPILTGRSRVRTRSSSVPPNQAPTSPHRSNPSSRSNSSTTSPSRLRRRRRFDVDVVEGQSFTSRPEPESADGFPQVRSRARDGNADRIRCVVRGRRAGRRSASVVHCRAAIGSSSRPQRATDVTATLRTRRIRTVRPRRRAGRSRRPDELRHRRRRRRARHGRPDSAGRRHDVVTISSPGATNRPSSIPPDPGQPLVVVLSGEGTHQLVGRDVRGGRRIVHHRNLRHGGWPRRAAERRGDRSRAEVALADVLSTCHANSRRRRHGNGNDARGRGVWVRRLVGRRRNRGHRNG